MQIKLRRKSLAGPSDRSSAATRLITNFNCLGGPGDAAKQTGVRRVLPSHADSSWGWGESCSVRVRGSIEKVGKIPSIRFS